MKYHQLKTGVRKSGKRVGRGISSGYGKTGGRGTKGQKARAGYSRRPGFEGGSTTLIQKLPKLRGFKSHRKPVETVTLSELAGIKETSIDTDTLAKHGLISSPYVVVKLVGNSEVKAKLQVKLPLISKSAEQAIVKAGGKYTQTLQKPRPAAKEATKEPK
jgi:large subunit ribosomal protein L15